MPTVMERTVTIDRALSQRAERKLRRYGWSMDDALNRALTAILVTKGSPDEAFRFPAEPQEDQDLTFDNVEEAIGYLHKHVYRKTEKILELRMIRTGTHRDLGFEK